MSELEFYRILVAGIGSVFVAMIGLIYRENVRRLDRLDRRFGFFVETFVKWAVETNPACASTTAQAFSRLVSGRVD